MSVQQVKAGILAVLLALTVSDAFAGWIFTERSEGDKQMSYIQKNRMKFVRADQVVMFDLNQNTVWFSNPKDKTYWTGTPDEFMAQVKQSVEIMQKQVEDQLPPEQREAIQKALKNNGAAPQKPLHIEIKTGGQTGTIAGYKVEKYDILINGKLRQEQWIAKDINVNQEIDIKRFAAMMSAFRTGLDHRIEQDAFLSPEVIDLLNKGWPLKRIDYDEEGYKETEETIKVEKASVPDSTFAPPKEYRKVSMTEIFGK